MKILHISKYHYPFVGGVEQVARDCVVALSAAGHEQKLVCFNHEKGNAVDEVDGVEIVRVGCFAKIASQSLSLGYGKALKKVFSEFQPEVVVFHYPNPFVAHFLLKELKKYPNTKLVLYWHLDITKQKLLGKLFNGQTLRLLERADKVVATSPNYIDGSKYLSAYREKCVVVPNCVPKSREILSDAVKTRIEEIRGKYAGKTICFALGRHVPYKGMEYLVRASKLLSEDFAVLIGGQGELTPMLQKLAEGDDKVEFLGRLTSDDVVAYLNATDVFCFPSVTKNEAFGIALAEGMYCAKPAVTFTIEGSGVNYVSLNGVTGIEVENGNVIAYANAIKTLAEDDELRASYGAEAKKRVEELFTYDNFQKNVLRLVEGLK